MLILSEAWFPGWTAKVDGHSSTVVRADGLVLGTPVPAGMHHVVFEYKAPGALTGGLVTCLVLLGFGVAAVIGHRRAKAREARVI